MIQVPMEILNLKCFIVFMTFFMFSITTIPAADPLSEALLSFKSELTDHSNSLGDWVLPENLNDTDKGSIFACSWSGVKCDENSSAVIGLDLSMKNLGGAMSGNQFDAFIDLVDLNLSYNSFSEQLPGSIFNLTNLRSLDISRNNFSGHFPKGISKLQNLVVLDAFSNSFWGPLPADVSQIETLKVLNFAGSYFNGPIPSEYGFFRSLDFIHLAGNFLGGEIPPELGMLQTVTHMEIGYNTYDGSIPWQLGNMSQLQYLDIAGANLSGPIPKAFSNLTNLKSLFLFRNQLNGMIPWEFSNLISLESLDLSDNLLSGSIPESFSELKNLTLLSLMYNDLSGSVPESIAELPKLETFLIWSNYFSGPLPKNLGLNSNLKYVDVSTNNFVGGIPPSICAGGMLAKLILFSNNFTGELHPSLSNCSTLIRLRVEDNSFSGEFTSLFSNLPDITYMDLSENKFVGGITNDILNASNLQYLNVSNNPNLGGVIPEKLWSLPQLQNFSAASCSISGVIPPFDSCQSLLVVEFGWNNLSGNVPESISICEDLVIMDLSNNNLSGHIPIELAALPAISILDLSHNSFSGPIPPQFGNSSSLKLLNVSYNHISGSIPQEKSFRMMDSSAFVGNSMLCGEPLRSCKGRPSGVELGSRRMQKFAWVLISCAVIALLIASLIFGILHFRRAGGEGKWKMVSFIGLPGFAADEILRSFNSAEVSTAASPSFPHTVCKALLPTGISVSVKKIELEPKRMDLVLELINRIGNARHKNLTRLLGFIYSKRQGYLLYDHSPNGDLAENIRMKRDWETKYRIILGIARGLCFLHHDCVPSIPHGDLKASNIVFDENMEAQLSEYGLSSLLLLQFGNGHLQTRSTMGSGEVMTGTKDQLYKDIYNFGELILEILTNGGLTNAEWRVKNSPKDASLKEVLLKEILDQNEISSSNSIQAVMRSAVEVALLCTSSRLSDRPSMEDVLQLLSGSKPQRK
ncbi:OLC1v1033913C1 [Oldenlandia corymbosa var. corymbosa]|uniref:OLC1v1033913C1 n=1 Tax=Oldenlandia corymbosa var. corymbosa TaxID=529605 RepID=A0AAV1CPH9_OLDCO|nr:OLC1v1033913C1 [Oldenlandia corymbosa var. corymbosa]